MMYHSKVREDWFLGNIGDRTIRWEDRFPNFGMTMVDAKGENAYIPIPRCGSQFFCNFLASKHNWVGSHAFNYQTLLQTLGKWKQEYTRQPRYFTILRDPLERYVSALWCLYDPDKKHIKDGAMTSKTQMDHLFSNPSLDDHHTINQYNFFYNIDMNQIAFFNYNDKDMGEKISHYFEKYLKIKFLPNQWISKISEDKDDIIKFLDENPVYMENIKQYLQEDYKFLSTVKYYEPN